MATSLPAKIELPVQPSDSTAAPPDVPSRSGTPNSTITTMSELSTVAIKDGHRGHLPHHHHSSGTPTSSLHNQLDAERADRISRLAGLERLSAVRSPTPIGNLTPGAAAPPPVAMSYFDASGNPVLGRERSTVGSASATGSADARTTYGGSETGGTNWPGSEAGGTTWPGSEVGDADKMSESQDMEMDASSVDGMSDEGTASLVGFGEGARTPARHSIVGGAAATATSAAGNKIGTPMSARDAMLIDGIVQERIEADADAAERRVLRSTNGKEEAERIVRENMGTTSDERALHNGRGQADLGKFGFEK